MPKREPETWTLTLTPAPGKDWGGDPVQRLRRLVKAAGRQYGMRLLRITPGIEDLATPVPPASPTPDHPRTPGA